MPPVTKEAASATDREAPTSEAVRQQFLDFFAARGHTVVESAPLVPRRDPTLLFTNAGMNQFKDVFLGEGTRDYARAADTQKCLRVSGKHNDLEEVGHDTYHHTFFEMLGNWSFGGSEGDEGGSYFKREAIAFAWELLVEEWGLAPDRLYATVHEGDDALGLGPDEEAARYWKEETHLAGEHVLFDTSAENFWMMGDTGPCGPCSEVHIDLRSEAAREETPGRELVNADHPQVMEIWNLVFVQYDAQPGGALQPLPEQHVDTGMGFERLLAVLQGKESTYDTDLFAPLLAGTAERSPRSEIRGYDDIRVEDTEERERIRVALRVVADHVRAAVFAIADGVAPGNEGRAYVIRRIARRAVRYGYQTLGLREPFLCELVPVLVEKMGAAFPALVEQADYVRRVLRSEEEGFFDTLSDGIVFFENLLPHVKELSMLEEEGLFEGVDGDAFRQVQADLTEDRSTLDLLENAYATDDAEEVVAALTGAAARQEVPGEVAFLLHDTYGFPVDLTRLMAREEGLGVDQTRYDALMQEQRERARAASDFGPAARSDGSGWQSVREGDATDFVGYDQLAVEGAHLLGIRSRGEGEGMRHEVVLDRTPFYAEGGGQVGDRGTLRLENADGGEEEIVVQDTQHEGERIVHRVERLPSDPEAPVTAVVDPERRRRIAAHHTATHLLHAALRERLGTHVKQKGSRVGPARLRFDFSHYEAVAPEVLAQIEADVNAAIQRNIACREERAVSLDEARARGATMLFGEKYGERVRVITFDPDFSMELCGGTHAESTGGLGFFKILSESSTASGVRRIEAVAGPAAQAFVEDEIGELAAVRAVLGQTQGGAAEAVRQLQTERDRLAEALEAERQSQLAGSLDAIIDGAETVGGVRLAVGRLPEAEMDALRELGQTLGQRLGDGAAGVLGAPSPDGEKVYVVATVAEDVQARGLAAGDLVGTLGQMLGGGGGGRPGLAAAGGRQPEKLADVLAEVPALVAERLEDA